MRAYYNNNLIHHVTADSEQLEEKTCRIGISCPIDRNEVSRQRIFPTVQSSYGGSHEEYLQKVVSPIFPPEQKQNLCQIIQ